MDEKYFLIRNSDGDTHIHEFTKEQLEKALNAEDFGPNAEWKDSIGKHSDTNYWGEGMLIVKGEIITPKEVKIITAYKL